jgi:anti-sigma-K factor RskA
MNTHEQIHELLPAYSLDCLDDAEAEQVAIHLAECPACRQELASYQELVGVLALAAPESSPSPVLKERILAATRPAPAPAPTKVQTKAEGRQDRPQRKPFNFFQLALPAWSVLSLVLIVWLGVSNFRLDQRLADLELSRQGFTTVALNGTGTSANPVGVLVINPDGKYGSLVVDRMRVLADNQDYQLWLVKDNQRESGGVFHTYSNGYGVLWIHAEQPLASYDSVGVTIEPSGGSPNPTGDKIIGGSIN